MKKIINNNNNNNNNNNKSKRRDKGNLVTWYKLALAFAVNGF